MATQLTLQCAKCNELVPHTKLSANHLLHLLLTVLTAGLWLFIWIPLAIGSGKQAKCAKCGAVRPSS